MKSDVSTLFVYKIFSISHINIFFLELFQFLVNIFLGINEENLAPPEPDSTTSTAAQQQQQFQTIEIAEFCSG